jgi:hypothetical protein
MTLIPLTDPWPAIVAVVLFVVFCRFVYWRVTRRPEGAPYER